MKPRIFNIEIKPQATTKKLSGRRAERKVPPGYETSTERVIPVALWRMEGVINNETNTQHRINANQKAVFLEFLAVFTQPDITLGQKVDYVAISEVEIGTRVGFGYGVVHDCIVYLEKIGLLTLTYDTEVIGKEKQKVRRFNIRYTSAVDLTKPDCGFSIY